MGHRLVVINPNASRVRGAATRDRLKKQLDKVLTVADGVAPEIIETAAPGETVPLVEAALADGAGAVIGVGGDGTIREVAAAVQGKDVPIGIVPAGTGNQLAAVLDIPASIEAPVAALETTQARTIDLGEVLLRLADGPSTSISIIGCGAGFDAELMATTPSTLNQLRRTHFGGGAGSDSIRRRGSEVTIEADEPTPLEIDGDYVGEGSLSARVLPGALDILVPADR